MPKEVNADNETVEFTSEPSGLVWYQMKPAGGSSVMSVSRADAHVIALAEIANNLGKIAQAIENHGGKPVNWDEVFDKIREEGLGDPI